MWCDMTSDGGGWSVFLSREEQEPPLAFNRTFDEYATGFGDASGEFWLGMSPPLSNCSISLRASSVVTVFVSSLTNETCFTLTIASHC